MAKLTKNLGTGSVLTIVILVVLGYVIYSTYNQQLKKFVNLKISAEQARNHRFGLIIDTRTPKERELLGFLPNSIPISINTLSKDVPLAISNRNTWILVYSNGDNRAQMGAEQLYRMGYPNVRYIVQNYNALMPGSRN